jgi:hypothetical protein
MTLQDLLGGLGSRVKIPSYQRSYSWGKDEAKDLLDDIQRFEGQHPGESLKAAEYFLGAIVGVKTDDGLRLIDGQQRIATLAILLSVIRDLLTPTNPEKDDTKIQKKSRDGAKTLHESMIVARTEDWGDEFESRLVLNRYDDKFFDDLIRKYPHKPTEKPSLASHKQIIRVRSYLSTTLAAEVDDLTEEKKFQRLVRLWRVVARGLTFVVVEAKNEDDATDVFEVLNERGMGLSTIDLLRNFLLGRVSGNKDYQNKIISYWGDVFLVSDNAKQTQNFVRHFWITGHGDVKARSLYREIKDELVAEFDAERQDPVGFSLRLSSAAGVYRSLLPTPTPSTANHELNEVMGSIATLGATALYPAALSSLEKYGEAETLPLMRALLSYYVRWMVICKKESTELETQVFKIAREITGGLSVAAAIRRVAKLNISNKDFKSAFAVASLTKSGHRKHVLQALENHMRQQAGQADEFDLKPSTELSVEHIYPQSPIDGAEMKDHDEWVDRIGNLSLLARSWNSSIKNGDFLTVKLPRITESIIMLNDFLKKQTKWGQAEITARQKKLAALAPEVWPLKPATTPAKKIAKKSPAKKSPAKKSPAKKSLPRKAPAKKSPARKAPARKAAAEKAARR